MTYAMTDEANQQMIDASFEESALRLEILHAIDVITSRDAIKDPMDKLDEWEVQKVLKAWSKGLLSVPIETVLTRMAQRVAITQYLHTEGVLIDTALEELLDECFVTVE